MSVYVWLGMGSSACAIVLFLWGLLRFAVRHLVQEMQHVRAELHPNGGGSFRDHVDRRFDSTDDRLDRLDRRVYALEQDGRRVRAR